jgi:hypothetical protein
MLTSQAKTALRRFGLSRSQFPDFEAGKPVAFYLRKADPGTIVVIQMKQEARLRAGVYTIRDPGGGLADFLIFEANARRSARALGAEELEILAIEVTNKTLKAVLEGGGFLPTTMEAPEALGDGTFDAISRIEPVS